MTEILIIRPQSIQLGDTICSLPMFKAIKKRYPDSFITFVGCPTNYNVNLKKLNPFLDEVIIFKKDNLKVQYDFYKELRKKKYDVVIVPSTIRISSTSYFIALMAKGKLKVGIKRIDAENNPLGFALDVKEEVTWKKDRTNQVYRFLDTIKGIGCEMTQEEIKEMRISLSDEEIEFGNIYTAENFPDKSKQIFGFHPGGGKKANLWDVNNYFDLIKKVYEKYNPYILITSGFFDDEITDKLEAMLKGSGITFTMNRNLDAYRLASVLKHINLYVSNDTGVMHLAAYAGTSTLSVFRNGDSAEWIPLFNNSKFVDSNSDNIDDIKTEDVFKKIEEFYP
ncbi:MAG: glycosyltransferase family 9 protein [Ignavibacteria bacterium]